MKLSVAKTNFNRSEKLVNDLEGSNKKLQLMVNQLQSKIIKTKGDPSKYEFYERKFKDSEKKNLSLMGRLAKISKYMDATGIDINCLRDACDTGVLKCSKLKVNLEAS